MWKKSGMGFKTDVCRKVCFLNNVFMNIKQKMLHSRQHFLFNYLIIKINYFLVIIEAVYISVLQ